VFAVARLLLSRRGFPHCDDQDRAGKKTALELAN
jgi:hypothetical protein